MNFGKIFDIIFICLTCLIFTFIFVHEKIKDIKAKKIMKIKHKKFLEELKIIEREIESRNKS